MRTIWYIVIAFIFVFNPLFSFFPIGMGKLVFVGLVAWYLLKKDRLVVPVNWSFLICILVVAGYSLIRSMVAGGQDYSLSYNLLLLGFEYYLGSILLINFLTWKVGVNRAAEIVFVMFLTQGVMILASFLFPQLNIFLLDILPATGNIDYETSFRARGFSNSSGASLSLTMAYGVVVGLMLIHTKVRPKFVIIGILIILISVFFVGRTGLYFALLISGIYFLQSLLRVNSRWVVNVAFTMLGALAVYFFLPLGKYSEIINTRVLPWVLELYYTVSGDIEVKSSTVGTLQKMWVWPKDVSTWLFGDGVFVAATGKNYISSDVGFIRLLWAVGVPFTFLFYLILWRYHWKLLKLWNVKYLPIILLLAIVVLESKEPFLLRASVSKALFLLTGFMSAGLGEGSTFK